MIRIDVYLYVLDEIYKRKQCLMGPMNLEHFFPVQIIQDIQIFAIYFMKKQRSVKQ